MSDSAAAHPGSYRVFTYMGAGSDVEGLAKAVVAAGRGEVADVGAAHELHFDEPTRDANALTRALIGTDPPAILQIVSHLERGQPLELEVPDLPRLWQRAGVDGEGLAAMLRGRGVRVVLMLTCHGDRLAQALIDDAVVDLAVGSTEALHLKTAFAFPRGFYRSLALGRSLARAAEDGRTWATPQMTGWPGRLEISTLDGGGERPLLGQPVFHVIGDDEVAVDALIEALAPHRVFHVGRVTFGELPDEEIQASLAVAKVVMVLFDGHRVEDAELLEQVKTAVDQARMKGRQVRLFPLYLSGTKPSPHVPYGLRRLMPAFLQGRGIDGDYGKLAARLEQLI